MTEVKQFIKKLIDFGILNRNNWKDQQLQDFMKDLYRYKYDTLDEHMWSDEIHEYFDIKTFTFKFSVPDPFEGKIFQKLQDCTKIFKPKDFETLICLVENDIEMNVGTWINEPIEFNNIQIRHIITTFSDYYNLIFNFASYKGFNSYTYAVRKDNNDEWLFKLTEWSEEA